MTEPIRKTPYFPYPPKATGFLKGTNEEEAFGFEGRAGEFLRPRFIDNFEDSVLILAQDSSHRLFRSIDNGGNFEEIAFNLIQGGFMIGTGNPDTDKSVLAIDRESNNSTVYRSTDLTTNDPANWEEIISAPSAGHFSRRYGWDVYDNVVLLGTYGSFNTENPPRFLYLSIDYGATFKEIEVVSIENMANPSLFHIHDCCYDPFNSRIWVATGDQENGNVYYSDDMGGDWNRVYPHGGLIQPTGVIPLGDRVLFLPDDRPAGLRVWKRNKLESDSVVDPNDIHFVWATRTLVSGQDHVANIPAMPRHLLAATYPYNCVLTLARSTDETVGAKMVATPDGEHFYDLLRADQYQLDLTGVTDRGFLGPVPNDPNKYIYGFIDDPSGAGTWFRLKMPEWK